MISPTLEEAKKLAAGYTMIPVALEIFSDQKTPIEVLRSVKAKGERCFILESVGGGDSWGRYSFLGYKPVKTISSADAWHSTSREKNPVSIIKELISQYTSPRVTGLPPFTGGFVGYFSYDFARYFIEGLELSAQDVEGFRDYHLMLIDKVIVFDHFKQKINIIVNIPADNLEENYIKGVTELKDMEQLILSPAPGKDTPSICGEFSPMFTREEFHEKVLKVKERIVEGDIFQAVISNRFKAPFKGSLINPYRVLRTINPSAYMVYMSLDDIEIACSSPETLVSLLDGEISVFPIAGTCPRGKTKEEDAALIEALLADEKELAEHDMLVDLARNDVGKVSRFGSVRVRDYRHIKRLSHVSHITSHVTGEARDDTSVMDIIAAAIPAGTLSGAPKKRACQIIDEVEGVRRGIYGGAIGYIDFAGNMDMCIGIRLAVLKDGNVFVQAGAGIVADSDPEKEYLEVQNKARAVMEALRRSGEV